MILCCRVLMRRQQLFSRLRYHLRLAPVHQASRRCSGPGETRYPFVCSLYATDASQTQAGSLSYASAITTRQLPRYAGCHGTSVVTVHRLSRHLGCRQTQAAMSDGRAGFYRMAGSKISQPKLMPSASIRSMNSGLTPLGSWLPTIRPSAEKPWRLKVNRS